MKKSPAKFYTPEDISYMLDMGGLIDERLIDALALLPKKIVDFVQDNCVIITIQPLENGLHWNLDDKIFKNKQSLIILHPNVWEKKWLEVVLIVAHEVAHAYLKHKIWMDGKDLKQEKDADTQAVAWLNTHWGNADLLKLCAYLGKR